MSKVKLPWWLILCAFIGCGPDPILLRPSLDTPAQHLANGHALLEQEKWGDARREFERATELDPFFTEAYVGLAIALGHKGEFEKASRVMDQARQTAMRQDQKEMVAKGEAQLHQMIVDQGFFK
jgi:thioredoxin-like negative regulator of GroEL